MNRWLLPLLSLLLITGCGPSVPSGVIVTGKITKGGTPVAPGTDASATSPFVTIASVTVAADGSSSGGQGPTDSNGAFRIVAGGKGVPPGKYRLHLAWEAEPGSDKYGGAYSGEKYIKEIEIPADKVGGELDLGTIELDSVTPQSVTPAAAPGSP